MNNLKQRPLSALKFIVVHHSATPEYFSIKDIRVQHVEVNGWGDIGYHYLITQENGKPQLKAGRPIIYQGAHTVAGKPYLSSGCLADNYNAIGLCIIGRFDYVDPSPAIVNEAAYAIKVLCEKFRIPLNSEHIIGHRVVDWTACPGKRTVSLIYQKLGI